MPAGDSGLRADRPVDPPDPCLQILPYQAGEQAGILPGTFSPGRMPAEGASRNNSKPSTPTISPEQRSHAFTNVKGDASRAPCRRSLNTCSASGRHGALDDLLASTEQWSAAWRPPG